MAQRPTPTSARRLTLVTIKPQGMLAVSPSDVWATAYPTGLGVAGPVILLHWQGHGWSKVTGPLPAGALLGPIARRFS